MTDLNPLVVAVTTRALCDLEMEHETFLAVGEEGYMASQRDRIETPVRWGVAYPLVRKLLGLNKPGQPPLVRVCVVSRNDPVTGLRVMRAVEQEGLDIGRAIFTKGRSPFVYLGPLGVDLFLSADRHDVEVALAAGFAAAQVMPGLAGEETIQGELRVALDGDSTLFDSSADDVYLKEGVEAFHAHEKAMAAIPLGPGPMAPFLAFLNRVQAARPGAIRTSLVTARAVPALERAIRTLLAIGVTVDEAYFLEGEPKTEFLRVYRPDLFLDDSPRHVDAAKDFVPTAYVPRLTA